ncbi:MAG TPA: cyclic pyranopterin monophosphate synthase MoaC [Abditibacteriaceae bacterium]|nr:cyclic pyranopterin monophosphate synthase MoaC [Abditibacteriaceae bacterium]
MEPELDAATNLTQMIDVGTKADTQREAVVEGVLKMTPATVEMVRASTLPKGNALETARVAAIMAAKSTPAIIPLCHPLLISHASCEFDCDVENGFIRVTTQVRCTGKTGVEMEALTAAAVALLTIYDMTKGVDDTLEILHVRLLEKRGGKSDFLRSHE